MIERRELLMAGAGLAAAGTLAVPAEWKGWRCR